jgi:hypothetical protein
MELLNASSLSENNHLETGIMKRKSPSAALYIFASFD